MGVILPSMMMLLKSSEPPSDMSISVLSTLPMSMLKLGLFWKTFMSRSSGKWEEIAIGIEVDRGRLK